MSPFEAASAIAVDKKCKDYANFNAGVALTIIGESLGEQGELEKAEQSLRKAVKLSPSFSLAHKSYGHVLLLIGKKEKTEYHFKQALRLNPKDAQSHALYAVLLENMPRKKKALEGQCLHRNVERERIVRLGEAVKEMDLPYRSAEDFIEAQVKDVIERSDKRKNASKA